MGIRERIHYIIEVEHFFDKYVVSLDLFGIIISNRACGAF